MIFFFRLFCAKSTFTHTCLEVIENYYANFNILCLSLTSSTFSSDRDHLIKRRLRKFSICNDWDVRAHECVCGNNMSFCVVYMEDTTGNWPFSWSQMSRTMMWQLLCGGGFLIIFITCSCVYSVYTANKSRLLSLRSKFIFKTYFYI